MSRDRATCTAGRCSTRAATRPSRSTSRSHPARSGAAIVPSGASTGVHEAVELRDGGAACGGKGVDAAVAQRQRRRCARRSLGLDAADQAALDARADRLRRHAEQGPARRERDPRRLARRRQGRRGRGGRPALPLPRRRGRRATLPVPMMNVINGGAHAANSIDLQEFMVVPAGASSLRRGAADRRRGLPRAPRRCCTSAASRPPSATRAASRPTSPRSEAAIEAILEAAERAGHREAVAIALDPATSEVYRDGRLPLRGARARARTSWPASGPTSSTRYPIVSIEDGAAEDDWEAWASAHRASSATGVQLVGDDLFVTNPERLRRGIAEGVAQLDPRQGEPDRHADRDARGDRGSPRTPATPP